MLYNKIIYKLLLVLFLGGKLSAQEIKPQMEINVDDLGNNSDEFQESFFEALKQKAITNHEKAVQALEKCIKIDSSPGILYVELGKNYQALKVYDQAEIQFKKALDKIEEKRYILELLYETYFVQGKFKESVGTVEKLVTYDPLFKEQLANLYFLEKRYEEAMNLIDELEEELGTDSYRQQLRLKIGSKLTNPNSQIAKLEQKIESNPKNEQNYINLIYLYSQNDQKEEAFKVAKKLIERNPKSELVHLALYKFYLNDNQINEAVNSIKISLASKVVDSDAKYKVVNDFLIYIKGNPQYESNLVEVSKAFDGDKAGPKIATEIGNYYYEKNQKELALNFYEKGLQANASDFTVLKRILLLQLDLKRFEKAKIGSELALELYPTQPVLYLVQGVTFLNTDEVDDAIESLETGVDFVIDDPKLLSDLYKQLSLAYQKKGSPEKAAEFEKKAVENQRKVQ
ncbi:hypothetical protein NBT05_04115 [Aquimarina sp. ERC-38]|uniref:tetratricopeptide repeat protein n=1 Tax=Aquimarina sp. ERC-38 TaxID=2949996 RepID=UPI00224802C4|nr:hypothetical protein [Aquimarina sp. ERC-38]UZO81660.1 hypothetical protein NBT05_04115 [Aquimarina sp. ERC-38]